MRPWNAFQSSSTISTYLSLRYGCVVGGNSGLSPLPQWSTLGLSLIDDDAVEVASAGSF
jgi:hypothetical protein